MSPLRTILVALFPALISPIVLAAPPARTPLDAGPIRIADCRITLIDHVPLACDRAGILKNIECKEGMQVTAKQVLAVIADDVARANLAVAESKARNDVDVRFNEKASQIASLEFKKSSDANRKASESGTGLIPVAVMEVQRLELAAEKAALGIEQAKRELELNRLNAEVARAELGTFTILAEFDGVINRVYKKKGEAVRQGDPVVELINSDRVRIEGRIGLASLSLAKPGAKVQVRLSIPDLDLPEEKEVFDGHITFVDLTSDPVTHETRIFAEVLNRNNILRAGLVAEMILAPSPAR